MSGETNPPSQPRLAQRSFSEVGRGDNIVVNANLTEKGNANPEGVE